MIYLIQEVSFFFFTNCRNGFLLHQFASFPRFFANCKTRLPIDQKNQRKQRRINYNEQFIFDADYLIIYKGMTNVSLRGLDFCITANVSAISMNKDIQMQKKLNEYKYLYSHSLSNSDYIYHSVIDNICHMYSYCQ